MTARKADTHSGAGRKLSVGISACALALAVREAPEPPPPPLDAVLRAPVAVPLPERDADMAPGFVSPPWKYRPTQ